MTLKNNHFKKFSLYADDDIITTSNRLLDNVSYNKITEDKIKNKIDEIIISLENIKKLL